MYQKITSVCTVSITLIFLITSCSLNEQNQQRKINVKEKRVNSYCNSIYDREKELIDVIKYYKLPTNNITVVLMPPTKCSSCKIPALKVLDTLRNVFILSCDSTFFTPKNKTQKLIYYDAELINKKGLVRLYSAIIRIKNKKVIKYNALIL